MSVDHIRRVDDLIELKKYDLAAREVRRALAKDPENAHAHYLLAWILRKTGKTKNAIKSAEQAIHYAPDDAYFHSLLGSLYNDIRKRNKAEAHHQKAIHLEPTKADFYVAYAYHLYSGFPVDATFTVPHTPVWKAWKEAMSLLEQALRLSPHHAGAYRLRALWLGKVQRYTEAHQDMAIALQIAPNNPKSHEALGDLYIAEFQPSKAFSAYREALRLYPNDKVVKTKLVHTVEARIPWIGVLWHISRGQPAGWRGGCVALLIIFLWGLFALLEWHILAIAYILFVAVLFILMNTLGDYLLTQAILKGWVEI